MPSTKKTRAETYTDKSKKMNEDIHSFLNHASNGDKESAQAVFQEILMDKIATRMENLKMDIAQKSFGFGEGRKFDDDDYEKDEKKKGEDVRKARRAKAQGKYQKPELEESVENLEESTLTKKHMIAAAKEVASESDPKIRQTLHDHHAKIFRASNPRFDASKFKAACNV